MVSSHPFMLDIPNAPPVYSEVQCQTQALNEHCSMKGGGWQWIGICWGRLYHMYISTIKLSYGAKLHAHIEPRKGVDFGHRSRNLLRNVCIYIIYYSNVIYFLSILCIFYEHQRRIWTAHFILEQKFPFTILCANVVNWQKMKLESLKWSFHISKLICQLIARNPNTVLLLSNQWVDFCSLLWPIFLRLNVRNIPLIPYQSQWQFLNSSSSSTKWRKYRESNLIIWLVVVLVNFWLLFSSNSLDPHLWW